MKLASLRILSVRSAVRIHALPDICTHRQDRDCFGLMLKTGGETVYQGRSGGGVISDSTHPCLLPKGSSYSWRTTGGECLGIDFEADAAYPDPVAFPVKEIGEAKRLFLMIEQTLMRDDETAQMRAISCLYQILLLMAEKPVSFTMASKKELLARGVEKMETDYSDAGLSVAQIAEAAGISEVYFRRIYTENYGVSPLQGLIALRMKKAVELLSSDYNSVSAIAEAVGYRNVYHFSKMFRQYYGVPPTQYRKV